MVDLKELEERLEPEDIIEILEELGVNDYIEKDDCIIFPTLCHHEDPNEGKKKLYYYKDNHKFVCYTDCGCSFDIFGLFRRRYDLLQIPYHFYKDIVLKVVNQTGFELSENFDFVRKYKSDLDKFRPKEINVDLKEVDNKLLNLYSFYPTSEWLRDNISIEAMKHFNILYSIEENKIIIPHYNYDGKLIGIRGRALNENEIKTYGKYMPVLIGETIYSHPLNFNLYGLNLTKNNIKRVGLAIVSEGEKSVLQYETMFGKNNNICVAACGSILSNYQIDLLLRAEARKVLIAFDREGETYKDHEKHFQKLKNFCLRYKNKCKMGFIFDTQNLLNLKESPFDRGKETFLQLYKGAIWL